MLNYFLEQQEKLLKPIEDYTQLESLRTDCLKKISQKNFKLRLTDALSSLGSNFVPHRILDKDFFPLFDPKTQQAQCQTEALFTSPIYNGWQELLSLKSESLFLIRSGFYRQEEIIYASILAGFDAVTLFCSGLDKYQIQYLTEVGRDFQFSILFIVKNKEELKTILETDAPYIALWGYHEKSFKKNFQPLIDLARKIPKSAEVVAFLPSLSEAESAVLRKNKIYVSFVASF